MDKQLRGQAASNKQRAVVANLQTDKKPSHTHTHQAHTHTRRPLVCDCECALKNNAKFRISREIFALIYQKALGQNKKPEKRSAQREPKYKKYKKKKEGNAKFAKRCRKNAPHKMANKSNKPTIFRTIFFKCQRHKHI